MADLTTVEMESGYLRAIENMAAEITRVAVSAFWFEVDSPKDTKIWPSEDLDRQMVESLRVGDLIVYSAECDDEGDLIMTKLKIKMRNR